MRNGYLQSFYYFWVIPLDVSVREKLIRDLGSNTQVLTTTSSVWLTKVRSRKLELKWWMDILLISYTCLTYHLNLKISNKFKIFARWHVRFMMYSHVNIKTIPPQNPETCRTIGRCCQTLIKNKEFFLKCESCVYYLGRRLTGSEW